MINSRAILVILGLTVGVGYCTYSQCQASSESRRRSDAGRQRAVALARANGAQVDLGWMYSTFLQKADVSMTARERTALEADIVRHLSRSPVLTIAAFRDVQEFGAQGSCEALFECFLPYCPFDLRLQCSRAVAQQLTAGKQFPLTVVYKCTSVALDLRARTRNDGPMAVIRGSLLAWEPSGEGYPMRQDDVDEAMR